MKLETSFDFDSAHRLVGYEGKCSNLHGHIWHVDLEIEGDNLNEVGILWDFTNVKKLKEALDHKTILKDCKENAEIIRALMRTCGADSVYLMGINPTAENLCYEILATLILEDPNLDFKVTVWESPKSSCEVFG